MVGWDGAVLQSLDAGHAFIGASGRCLDAMGLSITGGTVSGRLQDRRNSPINAEMPSD